jgi:DNA mismatch repair protein MutL
MTRIQQLPVSVITKIAAGEVIERPASVVKELLENSLDAGSTRIDIDVEEGGAELIRVVDNGHGIHADDLALAFSNHATSKLANADDLFCVRTLGFRGEALASIGGVGHVTLQSRPTDAAIGAEISCRGGELAGPRPWNGTPGTRIEVRHLFFNTPVRRKFLRSPATEIGHICETYTRLALARPDLHLTLRNNGKQVYEVPAAASLLDRIGLFFGKDVRDRLYALDAIQGPAHLYGFVADPACERGSAKLQYLFLNGRWIRDRALLHALQEGYRGLLMTGRYAIGFLFIDLPPDQVDVNVHPTKAEVRFRDANALYRMVLSSVRSRLAQENLVARLQAPVSGPVFAFPANGSALREPRTVEQPASLFSQPGFPSFTKSPAVADAGGRPSPRDEGGGVATQEGPANPIEPLQTIPLAERADDHEAPRALQLHNAYLVLETPDGMLVIDQHALHERILFEQIKDRVAAGRVESQQLLIPEPVDLPAEQAALVLEQREALAALGVGVEDFGGGTVLVTRYPAMLGKHTPATILRSIVDHLTGRERLPTREQLLSDLMSLMACHAAVRSGDALTSEAIAELIALRHLAADAHHCPHGRPTALLFTRQDLDRQFRRI